MTFSNATKSVPIYCVDDRTLGQLDLDDHQRAWIEANGFTAKLGRHILLPNSDGGIGAVLFGIGDENAQKRERLHLGALPSRLPQGDYHIADFGSLDPDNAHLAWLLGSYQFTEFKKGKLVARLVAHAPKEEIIAAACAKTCDLINLPANIMTPDRLSKEVKALAEAHSAKFVEIKGEELLAQNFPMIHAVGRASEYAPRLLELNWGDDHHPRVALVGKGVCFDTGGLDLKPSSSMLLMKKDMGGAANAIGLAQMIMALKLPIRLQLLIPAVENSVSANAFRPGDVLISRLGKSVEINNTDAEGRLVLADALAYAAESAPDRILSLATLTGAARVALGADLMPYFTDDEDFASAIERASKKVEDPLWRMPFWNGYEEAIEPRIADLDNAPAGGMAGAITAALFLRRFVGENSYAHFDIYGWTPSEKPGRPQGGAAHAIRAICEVLDQRYS